MTELQPLSVAQFRRRVEHVRDGAAERPGMTPRERGAIAGARGILDYVLTELDRVHCTCSEPVEPAELDCEDRPPLRLILGSRNHAD